MRTNPAAPVGLDELVSFSIVAVDHGTRRLGMAIKPPGGLMVLPSGILEIRDEKDGIKQLRAYLADRSPDMVVVGLPVSPGMGQAAIVKRFVRKVRQGCTGVRWRFVDESLTSEAARDGLHEAGLVARARSVDDRAAVLILRGFLQAAGLKADSQA